MDDKIYISSNFCYDLTNCIWVSFSSLLIMAFLLEYLDAIRVKYNAPDCSLSAAYNMKEFKQRFTMKHYSFATEKVLTVGNTGL